MRVASEFKCSRSEPIGMFDLDEHEREAIWLDLREERTRRRVAEEPECAREEAESWLR